MTETTAPPIKKRAVSAPNGRIYIINAETREILTTRDKFGNIYDKWGNRTSHINDY